jgi:hypothetical protein
MGSRRIPSARVVSYFIKASSRTTRRPAYYAAQTFKFSFAETAQFNFERAAIFLQPHG